jgi:hypothetical protein
MISYLGSISNQATTDVSVALEELMTKDVEATTVPMDK